MFPFRTSPEMDTEEILMKLLKTPQRIALPRLTGRYIVDTDQCNLQVRCVLLSKQNGEKFRLVGHWSYKLTNAEQENISRHKEFLVILGTVLLLQQCLMLRCVIIRPDHKAGKSSLTPSDVSSELTRWWLRLHEQSIKRLFKPVLDTEYPPSFWGWKQTGQTRPNSTRN